MTRHYITYYLEPVIEEFPTDTTAIEGEGVFFKVVVRGYPQPSLTWYHEDTQLTSDYSLELTQDGSLSITSTEHKHSGVYKLLAKNSSGSVEREVRLTVRQEEEEAAPVARERVDVQPVSVAEFGDYVTHCHSNSDEIFKFQYMVSHLDLVVIDMYVCIVYRPWIVVMNTLKQWEQARDMSS